MGHNYNNNPQYNPWGANIGNNNELAGLNRARAVGQNVSNMRMIGYVPRGGQGQEEGVVVAGQVAGAGGLSDDVWPPLPNMGAARAVPVPARGPPAPIGGNRRENASGAGGQLLDVGGAQQQQLAVQGQVPVAGAGRNQRVDNASGAAGRAMDAVGGAQQQQDSLVFAGFLGRDGSGAASDAIPVYVKVSRGEVQLGIPSWVWTRVGGGGSRAGASAAGGSGGDANRCGICTGPCCMEPHFPLQYDSWAYSKVKL
jgi:hypothetical protein